MLESNPSVLIDQKGAVGVITLNRPERLNAITIPMMQRLDHALADFGANEGVGSIVLQATGKGFCAGQDLRVLSQFYRQHDSAELGDVIQRHYNPVIQRIAELPVAVIAAVQGVAAGAGWSIAMACDLRLAARSASFVPAFGKLGLSPDLGGTSSLVEAVGLGKAMEYSLVTDRVTADEAAEMGLINRVVADEELTDCAMQWAKRIATIPREAVRVTKKALREAAGMSHGGRLKNEAHDQSICAGNMDHRNLLESFVSKP